MAVASMPCFGSQARSGLLGALAVQPKDDTAIEGDPFRERQEGRSLAACGKIRG